MKRKQSVRVPKQKRSIEKRELILEAAQRLFSVKGYHEIHSNAIAAEAGVAVGTFYAYFSDKKTVLLELIRRYQEEFFMRIFLDVPVENIKSLEKLVHSLVRGAFHAFDIDPDFHRVIYAMQFFDEDVKNIFLVSEKKEVMQLKKILKKEKERLQIKNAEGVAVVLHHAVTGVAHKIKLINSTVSEKRAIDTVTEMITLFLRDE